MPGERKSCAADLMGARLGYKPVELHGEQISLDGISEMQTRLGQHGGFRQQDRMILDKKRTLDRALKYSYQAATITKVIDEAVPWSLDGEPAARKLDRALINPNKLKQDYDDKILSVPKEDGYKPGDVFEWVGTNTYWLIYLQNLTELAYFRGDIRKCCYRVHWKDEEGNIHKSFAATRGPVETKINFIQKAGDSIDKPNYTLHILMPKTEEALAYFKRYSKFYLMAVDGPTEYAVCWRVEATDWISTPGVLELTAMEYYANKYEDDIEAGIVGGLIEPREEVLLEDRIAGDGFIKIRKNATFTYTGNQGAIWEVDKKLPITLTIDADDPRKVIVYWDSSYSGQFELRYGNYASRTIVVESLF